MSNISGSFFRQPQDATLVQLCIQNATSIAKTESSYLKMQYSVVTSLTIAVACSFFNALAYTSLGIRKFFIAIPMMQLRQGGKEAFNHIKDAAASLKLAFFGPFILLGTIIVPRNIAYLLGHHNHWTLLQEEQSRFINAHQELDLSDLDGISSLPKLEKFSNLTSIKFPTQTLTSSDIIEPFTLLDMANLTLWKNERVENEYENRNEAFDRIIEAAQNQSRKLNLRMLFLSAIPKEIGKLVNLQNLDFSYNQLSFLPEEIGKLVNLRALGLSQNQLISLSKEIGNLENLQFLDLSFNQLTSLPEEIIKLENLTILNLFQNQLSFLPEEIGKLVNLRALGLSQNQLISLSKEIGKLENLQRLNLENNQLTSLPVEIGKLENLQRLNLENNQLTSLPVEIGELKNLQKLDLTKNQLTFFPTEILKLEKLQELDLHNNRLSSLPEEIEKLKKLESLNLSFNQLTSLPEEIGKLENLQELKLWDNQLTSLPEELLNLENLTILDLSHNQLIFLPAAIGKLKDLQKLYLFKNHLIFLPAAIGKLENLTILGLSNNELTSLPEKIGNLKNLTKLDLDDNHLTFLPGEIGKLKNLTKLDLDDNHLTSFPEQLLNLASLRYLHLENNRLTSLPPSFFDLPRNSEVHLSHNLFSEEALLSIRRRVGNRFTVYISIHQGPSSFTTLENALKELKEAAKIEDLPEFQIYQNHNQTLLEAFFYRLYFCMEYKNIHTRKYIADFLIRCFKLGTENEHFKEIFLTSLESASGTCGDRVSVTLNYLHLHYCLVKGEFPEGFTPIDFFIGQKRLDLLDEAAKEFVQNYRGVIDEIEVYLALQVKLQRELKLPLLAQGMLYFRSSGLTSDILEYVKERVLHKTKDRKQVLLSSESWKDYICKIYQEEYEQVIKPYEEIPEHGMVEDSGTERLETDQEYHQRVKDHTEKRERAIHAFIEGKTDELLEIERFSFLSLES